MMMGMKYSTKLSRIYESKNKLYTYSNGHENAITNNEKK